MENSEAAQVAALVGGLGAVLVLLGRGRVAPLAGLALLGVAVGLLGWSLARDEVDLLLTTPSGIALLTAGAAAATLIAVPLARCPAVVPVCH